MFIVAVVVAVVTNGNVPYSYGCNACLIATVGKIVAILVEKLGEDSKK